MEAGGTFGRGLAKPGDEVSVILLHIEVEEVVVHLHVLVVLEGELHREVHAEGVVMNAAARPLSAFEAVELVGLARLRADEAVVGDFAITHPNREDGAAGDPALDPRLAALPPTPCG